MLGEMWDDWIWAMKLDPLEHVLSFLLGWGIGLFLGGSVMWAAFAFL